jgi:hypothetical protein
MIRVIYYEQSYRSIPGFDRLYTKEIFIPKPYNITIVKNKTNNEIESIINSRGPNLSYSDSDGGYGHFEMFHAINIKNVQIPKQMADDCLMYMELKKSENAFFNVIKKSFL